MTVRRVTFVGHDASRTGAPILLGSVLRWLKRGDIGEATVVLARGGPLVEEYRQLAPCRVVDSVGVRALDRVLAGVGSVRGTPVSAAPLRRLATRGRTGSDIVVANTLAALELATTLTEPGVRLVCHVHELDHVAERVLPQSKRRLELLDSVDRFIATGPAVESMLIERWGLDATRVHTVDGFIERPSPSEKSVAGARKELTRLGEGPVVLSVGATRRRKGPEMFVDLMGLLAADQTGPVGVWLGGDPQSVEWHETLGDIERGGLGSQVTAMASVQDPLPIVAAADVVVSTAREDPFPLVVLEAAALGVPVVGFDSGGLGHMLGAAGCPEMAVPFGDLFLLAERVRSLLHDDALRREHGQRLQRWVLGTHLVDKVAPALWQAITG